METMPSFLSFLFLSFLIIVVGCKKSAWEPSHHDIHRELNKKWKSMNVVYCQTFPELSPLPPSYEPLQNLIKQFSNNISLLVASTGAPSITANLIYDQDVLWTQGYGLKNLSDPSSGAPDGDTMYQIGSNTKLFTTLLALIAQDKGMMSFTDEVAKHVPSFSPINPFPSKRSIIFNQLASHMAGLQRQSPCEAFQGNCGFTNEVMWPRISNTSLVNPPGAIPEYSNLGFATLGHAVEEIWGLPWNTLIQQEIFGPLGMNHSGTSIDSKFLAGRAVGYTLANQVADLWNIGWESPAGAIYSSTNDMAKFVSLTFRDDIPYMQQPNQILDSLSIREWKQPRYINIRHVDLSGFGLPWEIFNSPIIFTKGGSMKGYLSMTVTIPQLKLGLIVLQSSDAVATYSDVFELFVSSFVQPFAQILQNVAPAPFIPPSFKQFVGTYEIFNVTLAVNIEQSPYYPVPVISSVVGSYLLKYISEFTFKISSQGMPMSCDAQQAGFEQYINFIPSSPPSFTIPGLFPDIQATKIA